MSSETKSRAGLIAKWRAKAKLARANGRWAEAIEGEICADELEALESSSSADTGGREAYRRGVSGAIEIIRAYKLPPSSSLVRETANELIETIARDIEAHLESAEAYADCGPARSADPGTTGAEGLHRLTAHEVACAYQSAPNWERVAESLNTKVALGTLATTQRAPVTPPDYTRTRQLSTAEQAECPDHCDCICHKIEGATPAPVTTPGRDVLDKITCKWCRLGFERLDSGKHVSFTSGMDGIARFRHEDIQCESKADEILAALAATKAPQG